ncbi:MAG: hypothetical protein HKN34_09365 [Gammaproteobacteria bacterium]|nr:hypothetical protein [Gammaproteobacteria bacterium]
MTKIFGLLFLLLLSGCASIISSVTSDMADNLTTAILNQDDLETVKSGAPAYLLMVDSMIEGDADNTRLLLTGAKLYSSYTAVFVEDPERGKRLADKSFEYASRALCEDVAALCEVLSAKQFKFEEQLASTTNSDMAVLYGFASSWAGWIQQHAADWNALADLPKLTALLERCVELDGSYDNGGAHLYLAILSTQLPPSLGGKPEKGRRHFELAREFSEGRNLMVDVSMARFYARIIFDKDLHDELLNRVLADAGDYPGYTLINTYAKQQASQLLAESDDYF